MINRLTLLMVGLLVGCAQAPRWPEPLSVKTETAPAPVLAVGERAAGQMQAVPTPALRPARPSTAAAAAPAAPAARLPATPAPSGSVAKPDEPAVLTLEQVSLGSFAQIVFAEVAGKNVNIDPQVMSRKDLVTFRSGARQTPEQLESAAKLLLKSYGVAVIDVGGLIRVVPDNANLGNLPEIRRGIALPETPLPLRPVFHLVELQSVRQVDVTAFLRTLFGDRVKLQEDATRNAVLLSGTPDNIEAALEAIRVLDQPQLAGGRSLSITPSFSTAEEFARRLYDVMSAQGYAVQPIPTGPLQQGGIRYPVIILPVAGMNTVYVFARGDDVIRHVESLVAVLDKPNERGVGRNFFTYPVRHKDAASLADTLEALLSGSRRGSVAATPAGGTANAAATNPTRASGVVVDKATNTLIFQAQQDEHSQLLALLQRLDQPSKSALIEVTVAELSMDDSTQLGIEWALSSALGSGRTSSLSTLGGLAIGQGGLNLRVLNSLGETRAVLNALASNNRANILSSPRVLARNGETATIQVGQEVPIITSQATGTASGVNTGQVLQTIQYRNTGVILKVKPVIHSGDQIDLDVAQEVSAASQTETGVNSSPTFSSRKLDTKLTLQNGSTVLLGGLISEERDSGNSGIPLLKDIPLIGSAFSKQSAGGRRRELIVLITPYVIGNNREAEELTRAFRNMLQPWDTGTVRPSSTKP